MLEDLILIQWHLMVFRNLNFKPKAIVLSDIEFETVTDLGVLLIFDLKDLSELLSQEFFVVNEYILWWFLKEIKNAHDEYQANAHTEQDLYDQIRYMSSCDLASEQYHNRHYTK